MVAGLVGQLGDSQGVGRNHGLAIVRAAQSAPAPVGFRTLLAGFHMGQPVALGDGRYCVTTLAPQFVRRTLGVCFGLGGLGHL